MAQGTLNIEFNDLEEVDALSYDLLKLLQAALNSEIRDAAGFETIDFLNKLRELSYSTSRSIILSKRPRPNFKTA